MNLLLVNYEYPPLGGGAANATFNIGKCLVGQGHRVTVLTAAFGELRGAVEESGVYVVRIPAARSRTDRSNPGEMLAFVASAALRLPFLLRKERFDGAIVFFALPCGPLGLWMRALTKTPYVISLRGGDVPGFEPAIKAWHLFLTPLRRNIYRRSLAVIANSEPLKKLAETADPCRVQVIPNGVDSGFYSPLLGAAVREPKRVLCVGRMQAQKNLHYLVEQVAVIARDTSIRFELHLLGDGPERDALRRRADELGVAQHLVWHGWVNDREEIRTLYRSATFLVHPSLYEGMPNCVLEAMACGVPVLASRVLGNDAVIWDGEGGFLFDLHDPGSFAGRFKMLLEDDRLVSSLGANARRRVVETFSWTEVTRAYVDLFDSV